MALIYLFYEKNTIIFWYCICREWSIYIIHVCTEYAILLISHMNDTNRCSYENQYNSITCSDFHWICSYTMKLKWFLDILIELNCASRLGNYSGQLRHGESGVFSSWFCLFSFLLDPFIWHWCEIWWCFEVLDWFCIRVQWSES